MVLLSTLAAASLLSGSAVASQQFLAPLRDIVSWPGANSKAPLEWLGANSPWFPGPNVNKISADVPEQCTVDQAAYVLRHGSRYPDNGAYNEWKEMESRFAVNKYTARGALSFLPNWHPVLTRPDIQIAQQSPTGYKEAMDLGYQLRTRYPQLYQEGDEFYVYANNYTRVLQTAENFVRGFIGTNSTLLGKIVSVTSKNLVSAIGNSLAPSDMCPLFVDNSGSTQQAVWNAVWQPKVQKRLQALIKGNLTLTLSDVNLFPYLCGFESQITGRLSPFCDVFTDAELKQYEYSNDLRYYYGIGPGSGLPAKMMTPFLQALINLLADGPGVEGTAADGVSSFNVPRLLMSFLNDGQLTELVTASGVFDKQKALDPKKKDDDRLWVGSRYVTMRGTIAFERLNCAVSSSKNSTYVRIRLNDQVYPVPSCQDGPGKSCLLSKYVKYVSNKIAKEGDWLDNCNVTLAGAPTKVEGASFFTDLAQPHVRIVSL
ncbi:histidine acid phosphatase [Dactylonectria estremocensis]|uniref:3-phytase n=1 Tax=Dactylonectria estremocensis TaxID=1079267 RepID=A0A9P9IFA3_9HYPO|nr:histidine acid phosphatase [Dactylonectria estremocensis]